MHLIPWVVLPLAPIDTNIFAVLWGFVKDVAGPCLTYVAHGPLVVVRCLDGGGSRFFAAVNVEPRPGGRWVQTKPRRFGRRTRRWLRRFGSQW